MLALYGDVSVMAIFPNIEEKGIYAKFSDARY